MKKNIYVTILLILLSFITSAQDSIVKPDWKYPQLNGHRFPSVTTIKNSFISTNVRVDIGLGSTPKLVFPGLNIDEYELFAFEGKLMFVNGDVEYSQRFNSWLAIYFSYSLAARLGTSMSSILVDGVSTIYGGDIGWLIRIVKSKKVNLSGSLGLRNFTGNFINVVEYFDDLINDNPDPAVIKVVPAMSIGAGLHLAYAISPTFGLQFSSGYAYGESFLRDNTAGVFNCGIVGDADLGPAKNIPIGFALGYSISNLPEVLMNYDELSHRIIGKLSYTGAEDFELGAQFNYYSFKIPSVNEIHYITNATLSLKFYF
jgi:hypothetical protein